MKSKSGHKRSATFQDSRKSMKKKRNQNHEKSRPLPLTTDESVTKKTQMKPKSSLKIKTISHNKSNIPRNDVVAQIRPTDEKYSSKQRAADRRALFLQRKREKENPEIEKEEPTDTKHSGKQQSSDKRALFLQRKREKEQPQIEKKDIWFEGVDPVLIAASQEEQTVTPKTLVKENAFDGLTRRVAIDCEFVGVGYEGKDNALARVSIVNQFGQVVLDTFVQPEEKVVDYRTQFSGVRPGDLTPDKAQPFVEVQMKVAEVIDKRILVGHSIHNDLKVLLLSHPKRFIRDTASYKPFRALTNGRTPALRELTRRLLGVQVQEGEHSSVEDARATMRLYMGVKTIWEASIRRKIGGDNTLDKVVSVNQDGKSGESKRQKFIRRRTYWRNRQKSSKTNISS